MVSLIKKLLLVSFSVLFSMEMSHASPANEVQAVIITPFVFAEGAAPQNVLDEMNIDEDLPKKIFDYVQKIQAFKAVSLAEENAQTESDIYIKGEILQVSGGSGGARYWGAIAGAGRSSMIVGVKVYDKSGQLLHEGIASQNGARSGSIFSVFSNKKNITTALNAIPKNLFIAALAGDLSTAQGVVRAMESNNPIAIQAGARSSDTNRLFLDESVTDSMELILLEALAGDIKNNSFIDGSAWCAINIGKSLNVKYVGTLERVMSSKAHKKIKKHAKIALDKLRTTAGE